MENEILKKLVKRWKGKCIASEKFALDVDDNDLLYKGAKEGMAIGFSSCADDLEKLIEILCGDNDDG